MKQQVKKIEDLEKAARFNKQTLIDAAGTLGASREIVIGALYDIKKPITLDEAKERIKAFLARPINPKKGGKA